MRKKCIVIAEPLTVEQVGQMQEKQEHTVTPNLRKDEATAFSHALRGSKRFLHVQGYLDNKSEDET